MPSESAGDLIEQHQVRAGEIDGARLFFPGERAAGLTTALRRHWDIHP